MVIIANEQKKIQKNRFFRKPKFFKLNFGDSSLVAKNEGRIELVQISFLKKLIKKLIKRKKNNIDLNRERVWYFGRPNFYIQKKSKNSRMGKGKGMIERKVIRVRRGFILLEFLGFNNYILNKIVKKINKKLSVKFFIYTKENRFFRLWSKKKSTYIILKSICINFN